MDVYPARETLVAGVTGDLVARAVPLDRSDVFFEADPERVARLLVSISRPGDLVLTLGAGDVTEIGPKVLALLTQRDEEQA
jgi:UDP-N-acetylmuramate--alanine ligase